MPSYIRLSKSDVLAIHDKLSVQLDGFTSEGNLDFIFSMMDDFPESADIEPASNQEKLVYLAAYLLFHLVKGHCFNDGNKRTAFLSFGSFLFQNGMELEYDEKHVEEKLVIVNQKIAQGAKALTAIDDAFEGKQSSPERKLIGLLFDLAGANPLVEYDSPLAVYPIIHKLIKWDKHGIMEDRDMMSTKKSKFIGVPADRKKLMQIVDELIRKNPQTMKLLEKS